MVIIIDNDAKYLVKKLWGVEGDVEFIEIIEWTIVPFHVSGSESVADFRVLRSKGFSHFVKGINMVGSHLNWHVLKLASSRPASKRGREDGGPIAMGSRSVIFFKPQTGRSCWLLTHLEAGQEAGQRVREG